jgi:hypothetical protein
MQCSYREELHHGLVCITSHPGSVKRHTSINVSASDFHSFLVGEVLNHSLDFDKPSEDPSGKATTNPTRTSK